MDFKVYPIAEKPLSEKELKALLKGEAIEERVFTCSCGSNDYILLPTESQLVKEGGKKYIICMHCCQTTHL
jgi:hypothetical protein